MKSKICSKCNNYKSLEEFGKWSKSKDLLRPDCKNCRKLESKKYYIKNKLKLLKNSKIYYLNNREDLIKQQINYRLANKDKLRKYHRKYSTLNRCHKNKYKRDRYKRDFRFKILCNLRSRINDALKDNIKSFKTMFLVGCEIDYLMYHIQKQFKRGMTWDNYGEWHIDHIKSCHKFNLTNCKEQQECFNYRNLRPLWAEENLKRKKK